MNYKYPLLIIVLFSTIVASSQDLSFEEYNPKSTLVVPGKVINRAKFPFIDVHGHQYRMATQDMSPVVAAMDTLNLQTMVNLSGGTGDNLKACIKNAQDNFPGRFVVFCNVDFEGVGGEGWTENAVKQLEADVKAGAVGLKIYKVSDYVIKIQTGIG